MSGKSVGSAGAATVSITPSWPVPGYFGNVFERGDPNADILAHAVVFGDGSEIAALVAADLVAISRPVVLWIKELCEVRSGIPAENVFVAANHDHSAPHAGALFRAGNQPDPLYIDFLVSRLADAVTEAHRRIEPARIAAGSPAAPGIAFNRRLRRPDGSIVHLASLQQSPGANDVDPKFPPAGPVDDEIGYVWFESTSGAPIACLMSFGCHNHASGSRSLHRDMFGRTGDVIRRHLGTDVPTPFVAGACGDVMWVNPKQPLPMDSEAFTWQLGERLADAVIEDARGAPRVDIDRIQVRSKLIEIADRPLAESEFCEDNCRGTDLKALQFAQGRYGPEHLALLDRGETSCAVEIGCLSIAQSVAISTNPAELFAEFGLEIRTRSPFDVTLISELTNGYCGYVPTEAAHGEGGYEAHRAVFASRLAKNAGRTITETAVDLLNKCVGGRPPRAHDPSSKTR